jgi:hypothetical protein
VLVRDVLSVCVRLPNHAARAELSAALTAGGANSCGSHDDAGCHIEVRAGCGAQASPQAAA